MRALTDRPGPGRDVHRRLARLPGPRLPVLRARRRRHRAQGRPGRGAATSASWPSWSGGPSTTGAPRPARRAGDGEPGRLDGPAREAAADDVLRAAGILPGDPSLYPRTLDDVFPFGTATDGRHAVGPGRVVATIGAHGITARLPDGFEGRIFVRPADGGRDLPGRPVRHVPHPRRHRRLRQRRRHARWDPPTCSPPCSSTGPRASAPRCSPGRAGPPRSRRGGLLTHDAAAGDPRAVRHPVVLHRGRPALLLLRRARQPRPAHQRWSPASTRCSSSLTARARRRRRTSRPRGRNGTDRPLPHRRRACSSRPASAKAARPDDTARALAALAPGRRRRSRLAAPRSSGPARWPRPRSGVRRPGVPRPATAALVAALLPAASPASSLYARRRGGPARHLRLLRPARHAAHRRSTWSSTSCWPSPRRPSPSARRRQRHAGDVRWRTSPGPGSRCSS